MIFDYINVIVFLFSSRLERPTSWGELFTAAKCSRSWGVSGGMGSDPLAGWLSRLRRGRERDGNGDGVSVLTHYCRLLRLLSGISASNLVSLAAGSMMCREEEQHVRRLKAHPRVSEFLTFLGQQDEVDRRTIWSMIGQEMCPRVDPDRSIFGQVAAAPSLRAANVEIRSAVSCADEVIRSLLPDGAQVFQGTETAWNTTPNEVVQEVLGMSFEELMAWQQEVMQQSKQEGEKSLQDVTPATGSGESEVVFGQVDQPKTKEGFLVAGVPAETIDRKSKLNEDVQLRLKAERDSKREKASATQLKKMDRMENRWRDPSVEVSFRPVEGVKKLEEAGHEKEPTSEGQAKQQGFLGSTAQCSQTVSEAKSAGRMIVPKPPVKAPPVKAPPRFPRSDSYTYTEDLGSDRTESFGDVHWVQKQHQRHRWDDPIRVAFFLPSGGLIEPCSLIVDRQVLPSQVANQVVFRPTSSGMTANQVQVAHNALDRMVKAKRKHPESSVGDQEPVELVDENPGRGAGQTEGKKFCARTGLPLGRRHKDWKCPTSGCPHSSRLVFAKWQRCPLCKAEKPSDDVRGIAMAADGASLCAEDRGDQRLTTEERRLLDQIKSKQDAKLGDEEPMTSSGAGQWTEEEIQQALLETARERQECYAPERPTTVQGEEQAMSTKVEMPTRARSIQMNAGTALAQEVEDDFAVPASTVAGSDADKERSKQAYLQALMEQSAKKRKVEEVQEHPEGSREVAATRLDVESSNESNPDDMGGQTGRPVYGRDWRTSTSESAAGSSPRPGFITQDSKQYMPEGGRSREFFECCHTVLGIGADLDSTIGYTASDTSQDGGHAGELFGRSNEVRTPDPSLELGNSLGEKVSDDAVVSPTIPFSLSEGQEMRNPDLLPMLFNVGDWSEVGGWVSFEDAGELVGLFVEWFSGGLDWCGSFVLSWGDRTVKIEALIRAGPWNLPCGVGCADRARRSAEEQMVQMVSGRVQNSVPLSRLDVDTKEKVVGVVKDFGQFDLELKVGQVRNLRGVLGRRVFGNLWSLGLDGREVLVALEDSWADCVDSYQGPVVLHDAMVIGLFGGTFLLKVVDGSAAIIRVPGDDDPLRVIDLFAGIGGWSDPLRAFWGEAACSVEIDECKAQALAVTLDVPVIEDLDNCVIGGPFVYCGDVFDKRWLKATWGGPFTLALWSSPCVSWSLAGYASGLQAGEGLLMLRTIGLLGLMEPKVSIGENVAAVVDHQHFEVVQEFTAIVSGSSFQVKILELSRWSSMSRRRAFIFQGMKDRPVLLPTTLPRNKRLAAKGVIEDRLGLQAAVIPNKARELLQCYELLPRLCRARLPVGFTDADVLRARVERCRLPTVMAAYRRQHEIPIGLLRAKGLFTFLVQEENDDEPRYLDHFEAARHMGFSLGLCLPADDLEAAHAIGNAVAPVQAFEAINDALAELWPSLAFAQEGARKQVMTMLYGQADLKRFTRVRSRKVQRQVPLGVSDEPWAGRGDLLFWGGGCTVEASCQDSSGMVSPYGYAWPVLEVQKFVGSLGVQWWPNFDFGRLVGDDFVMKVEPWMTICDIAASFGRQKLAFLGQVGVRADQPVAWLTAQKTWRVSGVPVQGSKGEIVLVFEGDRRVGTCETDLTFASHVDRLFPFLLAEFVHEIWDMRKKVVQVKDRAEEGVYQVFFRPVPFWIGRYGLVHCLPQQKVSEVQIRLAKQFHSEASQVLLFAGGARVDPTISIVLAEKIGPFEALVVPCPNSELYGIQPGRWAMNGKSDGGMVELQPFGLFWCERDTTAREIGAMLEERFLKQGERFQILDDDCVMSAHDRLLVEGRKRGFRLQQISSRGIAKVPSFAALRGRSHGCDFVFVHVAPYGYQRCELGTTIGGLQKQIEREHWGGHPVVRVTANGNLLADGIKVVEAEQIGCLRARVFPLKGGGKPLVVIEAKLTELLEEHGVNAKSAVSKTKELCEKSGHDRISQLLEAKDPWYKVKQEATDHGMVLIPLADRKGGRRKDDPLVRNDPWARYQGNGGEKAIKVTPTMQVDLTFLECDGKPAVPITMDQVFQGVTGVCVCQYDKGIESIGEVTKRCYTSKAAAVLFLGVLPREGNFDSKKVEQIVVPVQIAGTQGAARAVLVQAGEKPVRCPEIKEVTVDDAGIGLTTVLFQVYPEDGVSLPVPMTVKAFLRTLGFESQIYIKQVWATGWYKAGKKVDVSKAQYFHGFLKVVDDRLPELLRLSGRDGFFCTSRDADRNPDARYKVVFLGGLSLEEARSRLRDVPQHFGLVRSKKGFGIRVAEMSYADTKQALLPGAPVSSESDDTGPRKFKVMGLPTKVDRSQVKRILRAFGWPVKVHRQLGYQTWGVFAKAAPATRTFKYESDTIVISEDQEVSQQCVVGAGLRKPWGKADRNQGMPFVGTVTPVIGASSSNSGIADDTAKRFAQLEGQVATMRAEQKTAEQKTAVRIDEIARRTDGLDNKVDQLQETVGGFAQVVQQQLTAAFTKFSQSTDEKLEQFSQAQQDALKRVEASGEERLKELQELFSISPKVRKVEKTGP